jgi:flagellar biosynthesis/type III secretory pathway protein FliH
MEEFESYLNKLIGSHGVDPEELYSFIDQIKDEAYENGHQAGVVDGFLESRERSEAYEEGFEDGLNVGRTEIR